MPTLPKTKRAMEALTCNKGRIEYRCTTFPALSLYVGSKSKTWYLDCSHKKKHYKIKIAPFALLNYQQAIAHASTLYNQVVTGIYCAKKTNASQLFHDFFYKVYLPKAKESKRSWASDVSKYETHLKSFLGGKPLDKIPREDIEAYLGQLDVKTATRNKHRSLLSCVFRLAVEEGYLDVSPVKGIKVLKENNERIAYFTDIQSQQFDKAAAQDINVEASNLLICLKKTGARLGELQYLLFSSINFDQKTIRVPRAKNGYARTIYLSDEVIATLKEQQILHGNDGYVFRQKDGIKPIGHPRSTFQRLLTVIGLQGEDFHIHDLRHDFSTRVLKEGKGAVTLYHIGELLGHRSHVSTRRYAHIASSELHSIASLV
ncbi:tyrosine-type recombinase/integrase [Amphritea sp.]|uniref:tyrosine-type recombinase/integrase n=1 Tax=Amphritea sp. TaxID=1872502 RepID=UPI003A933A8E